MQSRQLPKHHAFTEKEKQRSAKSTKEQIVEVGVSDEQVVDVGVSDEQVLRLLHQMNK